MLCPIDDPANRPTGGMCMGPNAGSAPLGMLALASSCWEQRLSVIPSPRPLSLWERGDAGSTGFRCQKNSLSLWERGMCTLKRALPAVLGAPA